MGEFEAMNYLVTGGAGFIGSHLIDRLILEGHSVVCFDNFDNFYNPIMKWGNVSHHVNNKKFKLVSGTVKESLSMEKAFCGEKIDAVIHLAAQAGVRPSIQDPNLHFEVNVLGTINLLELCKKYNVNKIIYASSSSVYGNHSDLPFTETHIVDHPLCPYAASKKAGELICYTYHYLYRMDITCIRPFTVYGSRQRLEMAIPLFTKLIHQGKTITVYGDGTTKRDYTHVLDVISGIMAILSKEQGYEIYNLGTSQIISLNDLIIKIWQRVGNSTPPSIEYVSTNAGEAKITFANINKAKEKLGYFPKFSIDLGLDEYANWYLKEVNHAIQTCSSR